MKRFFIPVVFILFIFCGCMNNQEVIREEFISERIYNDNHVFAFKINLENLNSPKKTSKLIHELIYNSKNFNEYREYLEQKFIQETVKYDYPKIINEDGTAHVYRSEFSESYSIVFYSDRFVIIENKLWYYTSGAAHGNQLINYFIIDLPERKILGKNDLLTQIPDSLLKENIEKNYRVINFLRENLWPFDTITFHNGTVWLLWNTYSILPYSEGTISIEFSGEFIEQYLTKTGKELLLQTGKR